jgi:hypothetical protein
MEKLPYFKSQDMQCSDYPHSILCTCRGISLELLELRRIKITSTKHQVSVGVHPTEHFIRGEKQVIKSWLNDNYDGIVGVSGSLRKSIKIVRNRLIPGARFYLRNSMIKWT